MGQPGTIPIKIVEIRISTKTYLFPTRLKNLTFFEVDTVWLLLCN